MGAAVVRDARVLAARRTAPPEAAGRWELPGGKVEPGETPEGAVVRELGEELGLTGRVSGWLAGSAAIGTTHRLCVALVRPGPGEPRATEHDRLRWLGAAELGGVDWLEPDRPFLDQLARVVGILEGVRGIFFEEQDASAVARRLRADGYDVEVVRERLAGEDDEEDHPWAVLTDAPEAVLDLLVDEHDGWLDTDQPATHPETPPVAPLVLPQAPRRTHAPRSDG